MTTCDRPVAVQRCPNGVAALAGARFSPRLWGPLGFWYVRSCYVGGDRGRRPSAGRHRPPYAAGGILYEITFGTAPPAEAGITSTGRLLQAPRRLHRDQWHSRDRP